MNWRKSTAALTLCIPWTSQAFWRAWKEGNNYAVTPLMTLAIWLVTDVSHSHLPELENPTLDLKLKRV